MPSVGEQLRAAREAQNLTVYQVAEVTKIRTDHIRALDDGNYDVFAAPVYVRGFVRSYGTMLKLDLPPLIEQLNQELAQSTKHREQPRLTGARRTMLDDLFFMLSKLRWRVVLPGLGVLVILAAGAYGYHAWRATSHRDPLATLSPGLDKTTASPGDTLPLPK